jgi:hypothetical protein
VGLGKSAKPTDFKPRLPEGVQRVMPGARRKEGPRRTKGSDTTDSWNCSVGRQKQVRLTAKERMT